MINTELIQFLNDKVLQYNQPKFIESDPIQIPHQFTLKEDIEIAGFLTATIAWGKRAMIIKNANKMMELMDNNPFDFVVNHQEKDLENIQNFVHRTFNVNDFKFFITALKNIYKKHNGLEAVFAKNIEGNSMKNSIHQFKKIFSDPFEKEVLQHIDLLTWLDSKIHNVRFIEAARR